ncbi:MAG: hypothetical protein ABI481_03350 [Pyrinomonadaceae bacterium]
MTNFQGGQNPDVNSYNPDVEPAEETGTADGGGGSSDIERNQNDDGTPLPPDATPAHPVEEPPDTKGPPVGDVDDSPKRIAQDRA